MDGGRVLRALLAMRMPYLEATRRAVSIGKTFALLMALVGIFYSIWLILIALFIYFGASEEERGTTVSMQLEGTKVSELMTKKVDTVDPKMKISELVEKMLETRHMGFPVVTSGRLVGIITLSDISKVPPVERQALLVEDAMKKDVLTVTPEDEAVEALKLMSSKNVGRIVVLKGEKIAGIVTRSDLLNFIQIKTQLPEPTPRDKKETPPGSGW
jgi:CBS domain-containing protein